MFRFAAYLVATLAVVIHTSSDAHASADLELVCEDRSDIIESLASDFAEAPVSMGFTEQGTVLEILAGPDGSWTMIETLPSGVACLVANGQMWRDTRPATQPSSTTY